METFLTKAYLRNDSLYKIALQNGISNYLVIKYEPSIDTSYFTRSTLMPLMKGDTAVIEFEIKLRNMRENQIIAYSWQVDVNLNFKDDDSPVDTSFVYQSRIYIKQ